MKLSSERLMCRVSVLSEKEGPLALDRSAGSGADMTMERGDSQERPLTCASSEAPKGLHESS